MKDAQHYYYPQGGTDQPPFFSNALVSLSSCLPSLGSLFAEVDRTVLLRNTPSSRTDPINLTRLKPEDWVQNAPNPYSTRKRSSTRQPQDIWLEALREVLPSKKMDLADGLCTSLEKMREKGITAYLVSPRDPIVTELVLQALCQTDWQALSGVAHTDFLHLSSKNGERVAVDKETPVYALLAQREESPPPTETFVIESSLAGTTNATSAGYMTFGFLDRSCLKACQDSLRSAGAAVLFDDWNHLDTVVAHHPAHRVNYCQGLRQAHS